MNNQLAILLTLLTPLVVYGQTNTGIEQKMREIIIPHIEFREANPIDVLQYLHEASSAADPDIPSLGLLSTYPPATRVYYTYEVEDGSPLELHPLTLEYRRISLADAFERISKELGLTYRIENNAPLFFTQNGKRIIRTKHVEQAGPGYPPQGVGSPDP
jgi:hypothetical protein